jgi:hypothetical protein
VQKSSGSSCWCCPWATVVKLLPWELAHFFVWHTAAIADGRQVAYPWWLQAGLLGSIAAPIGYVLVVALRRDGRGPHDLVAGTRVVAARVARGTTPVTL